VTGLRSDDARVVAGLVPATPNLEAQCKNDRRGRNKPGHDECKVV